MYDLQTLQERELLREDRAIGLGRDQYMHVHDRQFPYDLMINTTRNSAFLCAQEIIDFVKATPKPKVFKQALKAVKKK
jgi:chloramphenicol 3-O-phosphotransferase